MFQYNNDRDIYKTLSYVLAHAPSGVTEGMVQHTEAGWSE